MKMIAMVAAVLSFSASGAVPECTRSFWKMAIVEDLQGLNPNQMCIKREVRIIHYATIYASLEVWEELLSMGANFSVSSASGGRTGIGNRGTPIHLATWDGAYGADKVRILLEKGVSVDAKDGYGYSPLEWAIDASNVAVVETLLENGGRLDVKNRRRGKFPCEYAKSDEMKKWLLGHFNNKSDPAAAGCKEEN